MRSKTILSDLAPVVEFQTTMHVDARFSGGSIVLDVEHVDWIGDTLVRVEVPGQQPLMLRTYEVREFAIALQALAQHIDEEPRLLHRATEPGQPSAEELQGVGL